MQISDRKSCLVFAGGMGVASSGWVERLESAKVKEINGKQIRVQEENVQELIAVQFYVHRD